MDTVSHSHKNSTTTNPAFDPAKPVGMTIRCELAIAYQFGNAKVYPKQSCVVVGDADIRHLRPKTFAVLIYLCEQRGRLVAKDELIQAVWQDVCVTDDSLVQCIVEIRRALGSSNGKYLRTVTRLGYLLHAEELKQQPDTGKQGITMLVGPFRLLTQTDQSHFAFGLSDAITLQLLQSSAMQLQVLADTPCTATETADYHLSGSLQTQDTRTRVAMQLINLSTQQFVWADVYEQQQADRFTLQDQLSQTIAAEVIAHLQQQK